SSHFLLNFIRLQSSFHPEYHKYLPNLLPESELAQKSRIILKKQSQVIDSIAKHGQTLDTHTKGQPCVFLAVYPDIPEYRRMYHAATHDFQPTGLLANTATLPTAVCALHVH